jgi:hypothetical protein
MWKEVFFAQGEAAAPLTVIARRQGAAGLVKHLEAADALQKPGAASAGSDAPGLGDEVLSCKLRGGPQYLVTLNAKFGSVSIEVEA